MPGLVSQEHEGLSPAVLSITQFSREEHFNPHVETQSSIEQVAKYHSPAVEPWHAAGLVGPKKSDKNKRNKQGQQPSMG
jgi:hypothetical protein